MNGDETSVDLAVAQSWGLGLRKSGFISAAGKCLLPSLFLLDLKVQQDM